MTLSLDTAYRSFGGEVEASSTPTICRLPDSRRHQLSAIARANRTPMASQAVAGLFQYSGPAAQTRTSGRQPDTAPRPKAPEMAWEVLMLAWSLLLLTLLDADNVTGRLSAPR